LFSAFLPAPRSAAERGFLRSVRPPPEGRRNFEKIRIRQGYSELKTYKHLYPQVYDFENLYLAWRKARKGKRGHEGPAAE